MNSDKSLNCAEKPPAKAPMSKSKRLSFSRTSLRRSKQKLDEFFKSPSIGGIRGATKRKRRPTDDDTVSLSSVDLNEPSKRRRSSLARIGSLVNLLSPVRPVKHALQKSVSVRSLTPGTASKFNGTPYRQPTAASNSASKRRLSTFWYETMGDEDIQHMNKLQIERQEAIFELYKCEEDLIEDLRMVKTMYHDSLKKLGLMNEKELEQIFGHIEALIPLHQELVEEIKNQRLPDGTTEFVGQVILDWVPRLECYVSYCANQVAAKALLDTKKQDAAVDDFLQRCQESPFSRRLDLWSFLDLPRSRVVKYPLLLKSIVKFTSKGHADLGPLAQAMARVEEIIERVDVATGKAKCSHTKTRLHYLDDKTQKSPLIEKSEVILCDGILKNNRGTKLHVFLFEHILVLTRHLARGQQVHYQVYRQPIPVSQLILEDLSDGAGEKRSGSFKSAFTQSNNSKHMFRVSFIDPKQGQAHTLHTNEENDKRHWLTCLQKVIPHQTTIPVTRITRSISSSTMTRSLSTTTINSLASTDIEIECQVRGEGDGKENVLSNCCPPRKLNLSSSSSGSSIRSDDSTEVDVDAVEVDVDAVEVDVDSVQAIVDLK